MKKLWLLVLLAPACSVDPLLERCDDGDIASCAQACDWGVAGDNGCLSTGNLAREAQPGTAFHGAALAYYERACRGGNASGCYRAAERLADSGGPRHEEMLELGCALQEKTTPERDDEPCCLRLGELSLVEQPAKARSAFERACAASSDRAHCFVAFEERLLLGERLEASCKSRELGSAAPRSLTDQRLMDCTMLASLLDERAREKLEDSVRVRRGLKREDFSPHLDARDQPTRPLVSKAPPLATALPVADGPRPQVELSYYDNEPRKMDVEGGLDWFRVHVVLKTVVPRLQACAATKFPSFETKPVELKLELLIDNVGVVQKAFAVDPENPNGSSTELGYCIADAARELRFEPADKPTALRQRLVVIPSKRR